MSAVISEYLHLGYAFGMFYYMFYYLANNVSRAYFSCHKNQSILWYETCWKFWHVNPNMINSHPNSWSRLETLTPHYGSCCALQWRHNGHDGVSNDRRFDCLFKLFVLAQIKENIKVTRHWPLWGEVTGDSPHKGPVTRKGLPFENVIMDTSKAATRQYVLLYKSRIQRQITGTWNPRPRRVCQEPGNLVTINFSGYFLMNYTKWKWPSIHGIAILYLARYYRICGIRKTKFSLTHTSGFRYIWYIWCLK